MSVRHAILGILLKRPSYPYELSVSFDHLVGHAWLLKKAQVYQTVERLEAEGLVERTQANPNARGARWIYKVTPAGAAVYERWRATSSTKPRPLRDELLIKIALAREEDADDILQAIDLRTLLCAERLREYTEMESKLVPLEEVRRWEEAGPALSMNAALSQINAELGWLATARQAILQLKERGALAGADSGAREAGSRNRLRRVAS